MWRKLSIGLMALSLLLAASLVDWVKTEPAKQVTEQSSQGADDPAQAQLKSLPLVPQQHGQVSLRVLLPAMPIWSVFDDEDREMEVPRSSMPDALIFAQQILLTHIIPSLAP